MLKLRALVLTTLALTAVSLGQLQEETKSTPSPVPLTVDQIAVYRTFLQSYDNGSNAVVNLANKTVPLYLAERDKDSECLKGIKLEDVHEAASVVHMLDFGLAVKGRVVLVDPEQQVTKIMSNYSGKTKRKGKFPDNAVADAVKSGLLSVSEIAFDKDHHFAILNFSFECGILCGRGATFVLEKTGEEWKVIKRQCAGWES
jgi:hypothetical protein